ncbi:mucin-12 isoform X3 [Drosophila albomicans]|uniref:Mucin-12 isoform X3 n=1 Tax=Drosophila albomicans TaxID=7291 RepID=A0A6P8WDT2_DROAB|nr:mucin-12 isoform X3 [Drosophila albomicans]
MTADPISLCFWICLQPERYVPGSPIFRDSSPTPNATPTAPITVPPTTAATTTTTTGVSPTSRSRGQAHGNATATSNNKSNTSSAAKQLPTCYMSTRSAAMMALALGQQTRDEKTTTAKPASPRTHNRNVSTAPTPVRPTSTPTATASTSKSTTPTATTTTTSSTSKPTTPTTAARAAAQLNGMGILSGGSNSSGSSDNDGFSTSGSSTATALRRLYFKSGRSIKNKINSSTTAAPLNSLPMNPVSSAYHNSVSGATAMHSMGVGGVPKLVVMGASSASIPDTNINTSTDSACTLITNVTHTDTSETCDSLDLGDNSGPSEPLFSSLEEPLLTAIQIDSEHETSGGGGGMGMATEMELTSCSRYPPRHDMNLQDSTESQESCLSILTGEPSSTTPLLSSRQPSTAPPPTRGREHFTFDPPQSPKSARSSEKARSHFTFKEDAQQAPGRRASSAHYNGDTAAGEADSKAELEPLERSLPGNRSKKLRSRERDAMNGTRNRISPSVSPSSSSRTSPKRERKRTTPSVSTGAIAKINSAPPTMKDGNFFGSCQKQRQSQQQQQQQLSPSASSCAQQRKYSSSSSSGSSERCLRDAAAGGTMFPFDREALDYERIQRECFAPSSVTASTSSDSDEAEHCSVYERKLSTDIFQQYSRLSQQEQQQHHDRDRDRDRDRERPPSRKNSKRIRPDSVIHTTIRENQQYVPQSDAFYPQAKSSSSPSDHSYAELNKFEDIASKFEQIPPKHGSNSTLNLHLLHMHSPGSESLASASLSPTDATRKRSFKSKAKSKAQQQQQQLELEEATGGGGNSSINVTANPLEAAAVCKQPRATIVVQQPSLSMDNTVETLLIKNEGDFISVEQGKELNARKRHSQQLAHPPHAAQLLHHHHHHHQVQGHGYSSQQQQQQQQQQQSHNKRDENMRQLLDVTNTLTIEELRDFEMRYGSPHHSRSQSVKMPGSRASGRPNQLCLPQQRSRVASMPNTGVEEEYYRLRHFSITGKGVVNRGDSLKSRRSRSNNSVASSNSSTEHLTAQQQQQQQQQQHGQQQLPAPSSASARTSLASSRESSTSNPGNGPYRVLMLGGPAVGKSSLVSQFMTSEYLHAYDTSIDLGNCDIRIHIEKAADDDESGEKAVSVLLSGEESELIFIDHGYTEMTPNECLTNYDPHGYCVIYSAADRSSFSIAEQVLQVLWTNQNIAQKAVILVSNKADLARSRLVTSEEGKAMATAYDCKFIETSVGINHNVDELLVGLLSQIRLKLENPEKSRDLFRKRSIRKSKRRACSPLSAGCLNANTPLGPLGSALGDAAGTPPGSAHSSPRKYRGSRTSTSLKVKGLLGRVWTRDSKSKSCENLHVL